jgi:hypothetical protein
MLSMPEWGASVTAAGMTLGQIPGSRGEFAIRTANFGESLTLIGQSNRGLLVSPSVSNRPAEIPPSALSSLDGDHRELLDGHVTLEMECLDRLYWDQSGKPIPPPVVL